MSTEYLGQEYVEICHGNICQTTLSWIFVAAYADAQLQGGFQLEFVSISQVINHMTCHKSKYSTMIEIIWSN